MGTLLPSHWNTEGSSAANREYGQHRGDVALRRGTLADRNLRHALRKPWMSTTETVFEPALAT
jgi:hypothetical protein